MPTRKLEIELIGDSSSLSKSLRGAVRDADTFGSRLRHAGVLGAKVLGGGVVAAAAAATVGIVKSAQAAEEANKVHAQTGAVLKSTGHAAGVSQKQVEGLAESIMRKTGIDDEAILTGQNLLLTFKNIKNEAGEGNNVFDQATQAMVDMSSAMGTEASGSAIQLGKALNDPIKGISALSKVGVSFSEQQKKQIEQWVEEGDTLRAQKAILKELNSEFGGSAEAQATAMEKIKTSVGNVEESIGNVFLPIIDQAATKLNRDFVPELQHTADGLARIAGRKNIDMGEKLGLAGNLIERQWGDVPAEIGHVADAAVPIIAERSGQLGIAAAKGMLHGFVHADPLGKAAILLFASKAFGGPAAVIGAGKSIGSKFGGAAAAESALAMSTFGMGSSGTKAFGLIDKAKGIGKTVGKAGLAIGVISGLAAGLEDADSPSQHLQNALSSASFGLIPAASGSWGNQMADGLMADWDHRLPEVQKHIKGRTLEALAKDRGKLAWTYKVAVATGASQERVDALRGKLQLLDRTISGIKNADKDFDSGISGLEGGKFTRLGDIKTVVAANNKAIANSTESGTQEARDAAARNFNAAADAIKVGMDRSVINAKRGMAEIRSYTRDAHLISGDDPWGIAKGFSRTWERAGSITKQNLNRITQDLGKMPEPAARASAQMMLSMARELRSKGQLTKGEVERLRSAVVTKLGLMATQGGKKGEAFRTAVGGPIGGLSIDVAEALENIGVNVGGLLEKLGADNPLMGFTMNYFKGHGGGGSGKKYLDQVPELNKARGGPVRVPGQGMHDSVGLAVNNTIAARVAPGEDLVVFNRHQRPMVDRALANEYGVAGLPGFFDNFDRPHYLAKGGFAEPRVSGPDPLRGGAQAGIHTAYKAGKAFIKAHRPKPKSSGSGNTAYTGPPPNMKQLGDNAWVDSHTLAVLNFVAGKFGMSVTDGFRTPEEAMQYPSGMGSYHTHGSPSNPGAGDISTPGATESTLIPVRDYMAQHVAGIAEGPLIDNVAGWNMHTGFFSRGGRVGRFAGGGIVDWDSLVGDTWDNDELATLAHIVGMKNPGYMAQKAQGESSGDASAVGHDPGGTEGLGLWQITTGFNDDLIAKYGGRNAMFDPLLNAKAAKEILDEQGTGAWYAPATGELGHVDKGLAGKIRGAIAGKGAEDSAPASKAQKHTLAAVRRRAERVVTELKGLRGQYKKLGGTKRGKAALERALKFAEQAARKAKAGSHDQAKDLIDKARNAISKARDSQAKAAENVFTPGLKAAGLPDVATTTYDPSQEFSETNLPGLGALPESVRKMLKSPGLGLEGQAGILDTALTAAGATDTKVDDAAALNAMLGIDRKRKAALKKALAKVNNELGKKGLIKKQREGLQGRRDSILQSLGEVTSAAGSVREQIRGLNEEGEEVEDPAVKAAEEAKAAAEEQKRAAEELTAQLKSLQESVDRQNEIATSEMGINLAEAKRAMADMIEGQLGPRVSQGSLAVGIGTVGSS